MRCYPEEFKSQVVETIARPGGPSATALSHETRVPETTLSRWLRRAGTVEGMRQKSKRPQDWTAQEKLEGVREAEGLSEEELGAFLRRQGLPPNPPAAPDHRGCLQPLRVLPMCPV